MDGGAHAKAEAAPRVAKPPGDIVRKLDRLGGLIEEHSWDQAFRLSDELLSVRRDGWLPLDSERYTGVVDQVQRRLVALRAEGLVAYRRRADPLARQWLERGVAARDADLLRRVVDQAFCSTVGDEALWALGELELEVGNYAAARAAWQRVRPEAAPAGAFAYPDSPINLAAVRARIALASIRAGELERAEREVDVLGERHANETGRLGGRDVNFAERLGELIEQSRTWPSLGLRVPRNATLEQAWSIPIESQPPLVDDHNGDMAIRPMVVNDLVVFGAASGVHAVQLTDGKNALPNERLLIPTDANQGRDLSLAANGGRVFVTLGAASPAGGRRDGNRRPPQLVALDLSRDGAILWQQSPEDEAAEFSGPVVALNSRVLVAEITRGANVSCAVVGYDLWTSRILWRLPLGSISAAEPADYLSVKLIADGGAAYVITNFGMIAALRAADGEPLWLRTYDRQLPHAEESELTANAGGECVATSDLLLAAPADAGDVMALDAATGELRWSQPRPVPDARLTALAGERVLLAGQRLWSLRLATGDVESDWGAGLRNGAGQGALAGELFVWPTRDAIELIDPSTGQASSSPHPLPEAGPVAIALAEDAVTGDDYIIAAGRTHLTAFRRVGEDASGIETPRDGGAFNLRGDATTARTPP